MAGTLTTIDMLGPGSYGLNTQDNTSSGSPLFATEAFNAVIDSQGRLAARKGFVRQNATPTTNPVNQLYLHTSAGSVPTVISAHGGSIYRGKVSLTQIHSSAAGDNWAFATLAGHLLAAQDSEALIVFEDSTWSKPTITNTKFVKPNVIAVGYGRAWAAAVDANDYVVYWSDLLNPLDWDTGDSGQLDLTEVFVNGKDTITGITVFNNRLVIFCRKSIYVYALPPDDPNPALMQLVDTVKNVGCIARDSIVHTGNDVVFLSDSGLMSLGRLFDSNFTFPINNMSRLVQQQFLGHVLDDNVNTTRATYFPNEGMYLISSVANSVVYTFNTILPVPEMGTPRVTIWRDTITPVRCFTIDEDGSLLVGMTDGVYKYSGYGDLNAPYELTYRSQWLTFGQYAVLKHLKKMRSVIEGGGGQVGVFRWAFDYVLDYDTVGLEMQTNAIKSYYNVAEFGIAEFTGGVVLEEIYENIGGSGRAIMISLQAPVAGEKIALQTVQLFANKGKVT